jgi:hypothetical protein
MTNKNANKVRQAAWESHAQCKQQMTTTQKQNKKTRITK